jgi:hypothetical protein
MHARPLLLHEPAKQLQVVTLGLINARAQLLLTAYGHVHVRLHMKTSALPTLDTANPPSPYFLARSREPAHDFHRWNENLSCCGMDSMCNRPWNGFNVEWIQVQ